MIKREIHLSAFGLPLFKISIESCSYGITAKSSPENFYSLMSHKILFKQVILDMRLFYYFLIKTEGADLICKSKIELKL